MVWFLYHKNLENTFCRVIFSHCSKLIMIDLRCDSLATVFRNLSEQISPTLIKNLAVDKCTSAGNDADAADCWVWSGSVSHYSPDVLVLAEALCSTANEICRWFISCKIKASLPEFNLQFREKGKATGNDRRIQMTVRSPQRNARQFQYIKPLVLFSSFHAAAMKRNLTKMNSAHARCILYDWCCII